jgi:Flp pilus assembly protein TadG
VHAMATLKRSARRNERGQAIVELALTLPLLLLVVLGVFDFGLMFQRYEVVTNAAREGARVGVLPGYSPQQAQIHAQNYLAAGGVTGTVTNSAGCSMAVSPGTICVSVQPDTTTLPAAGTSPAQTIGLIKATVSYDHAHVFVGPIIQLFGGSLGTVRLKAVSQMRLE